MRIECGSHVPGARLLQIAEEDRDLPPFGSRRKGFAEVRIARLRAIPATLASERIRVGVRRLVNDLDRLFGFRPEAYASEISQIRRLALPLRYEKSKPIAAPHTLKPDTATCAAFVLKRRVGTSAVIVKSVPVGGAIVPADESLKTYQSPLVSSSVLFPSSMSSMSFELVNTGIAPALPVVGAPALPVPPISGAPPAPPLSLPPFGWPPLALPAAAASPAAPPSDAPASLTLLPPATAPPAAPLPPPSSDAVNLLLQPAKQKHTSAASKACFIAITERELRTNVRRGPSSSSACGLYSSRIQNRALRSNQ